ncbi:MAG: PTS-dependent dihydroxyacetone kinase phosphotransferase subunit DhaM [Anaerolineae bacterium]|nr:PTS-dependent dihydroxyacetone kinase phosphotransferase subunit DhaM [Anaerolineae bacterium]
MVGIVIVSHSPLIAAGVKQLASEMAGEQLRIAAAGGVDDHTIGTSVERILEALREADGPDGVLILVDLGSAVLSAQAAIELLNEQQQAHLILSNAPLVEGAIVAAVEASIGRPLMEVNRAAEQVATLNKLG